MSFNPDKCEVILITKKRRPIDANYTIHGKQECKVPGSPDQRQSWNAHVDTVTKKAIPIIQLLFSSEICLPVLNISRKLAARHLSGPSWNMQQLFGTHTQTSTKLSWKELNAPLLDLSPMTTTTLAASQQ